MKASWPEVQLGEVLELQRGYDLPETQREAGTVPVIGSAGLTGFHNVAKVRGPGVTVGRSGASFGKAHYINEDFWPHNATLFVRDFKGNDPKFVFYMLLISNFDSFNSGSAQQSLNRNYLYNARVSLPPLSTQRKITSILSAYDDLIENDTRRVQVLEEMARALYREWFVEFRFPGHETAEFVEDAQGRRPEGWASLSFKEMFESTLGGDWGSDEATGKDLSPVKVIRGTDFTDLFTGATLRAPQRFIDGNSLFKRKLRPFDLILENSINAKTRTAGTPFLVSRHTLEMIGEDAIAASFCKVYRPKPNYINLTPVAYLYLDHMIQTKAMEYFQNIATNGIANLQSQKLIAEGKILIPPKKLLGNILPLFTDSLSQTLAHRIQNLRRTRDLLLPRLVSGELDVSALAVRGPGLAAIADEAGKTEGAV